MKSEMVNFPNYFKGIREIERQLDRVNTKILSAMWKYGPRNLLEVSRRTRIPFTSVYHRVRKLEAQSGRVAYLVTPTSKLGLVRSIVLAAAKPGEENLVTSALKVPNLWRIMNRCDGAFTHLSVQTMPMENVKDFRAYLKRLTELNLITQSKVILTGDCIPNFQDFRYYDATRKRWTFPWNEWFTELKKAKGTLSINDPQVSPGPLGKKDLLIIKELEKNARISLADLAPVLGITLQGVKYHYDRRLLAWQINRYFAFDVYPYPIEISAYHEHMIEFSNTQTMNRFFSLVPKLFFIRGVAKVLKRNALTLTTYIPETQFAAMLEFFSRMTNQGLLESYFSVRLQTFGRETQTISYELFDEQKGWIVNPNRWMPELRTLRETKRILAPRK